MERFKDRRQAGQLLADALSHYQDASDTLILALPRGGIPVAYEVAKKLHLPFDLCLVRKLGVPGQEELAMGAIAYDGEKIISFLNEYIIKEFNITPDVIQAKINKESAEIYRRNKLYRDNKPFPVIKNKTVIIVDDGVATSATMRAALAVVKKLGAKKIIAAAPVCANTISYDLKNEANEIICLLTPDLFFGVGQWYENFEQVDDSEVLKLLS